MWDCESKSIPFVVVYDVSFTLCLLSCNGVDVKDECYLDDFNVENAVGMMSSIKVKEQIVVCERERF